MNRRTVFRKGKQGCCAFSRQPFRIPDEPEAALSPAGIIRLIRNMDRLVRKESQFIISTHSPMLMAFPGAEIYQIQKDAIVSLPYDETEHYKMIVRFLRNPQSALEDLLGKAKE